jgi:hypothetical protein
VYLSFLPHSYFSLERVCIICFHLCASLVPGNLVMLREGIPVFNNISSILVKTLVAFSIYSLLQGLV